ncbi:22548_t:CDS:2 [Gigaspora margarita]|uniref:22548_t:CDS:1 n=1 Tax=Gigaspora margarita TaxID=4874 RepID=A0ABN7UZB3_GIGMA|nr:22548_t:CDS:2 [Gigaspora margarita]
MPRVSKQKLSARKASQVSAIARKAAQKEKTAQQEQAVQQEKLIQDINNILIQMDNNKLQQVYQIIVQPINNKKINQTTLHQRLINKLASLPLTEIGCNSSDLIELRIKKHQQQTEFNNSISIKKNFNNIDSDHEESANKLLEDLFGRK